MCFRKLFKKEKPTTTTTQKVEDKKEVERLKKISLEEQQAKKYQVLEVEEEDVESDEEMTLEETKALEKEEKKNVKNIYHISQNKKEDSEHYKEWRVRKEGSQKTIKFFRTQKEAIDFANKLIQNNDGQVVVHGVNGRIRKQGW